MKLAVAAVALSCGLLPVAAAAADQPLAWQLIGTNPDVYAPSFPQPKRGDYFHRADLRGQTFLHPEIGMSFAALRLAERCERADRTNGDDAPLIRAPSAQCAG